MELNFIAFICKNEIQVFKTEADESNMFKNAVFKNFFLGQRGSCFIP